MITYVVIIINGSLKNAILEELFYGTAFFPVLGFLEQRGHRVSPHLYISFLPLESILNNLDHVLIIVMQTLKAMHNKHLAALPVPGGIQLKDLLEHGDCHVPLFGCD